MIGAKTSYVTTFWRMTISPKKTNITALIIVAIIIMTLSITIVIKMAYDSIRIHSIVERIGLMALARMFNGLKGEAGDLSQRHKSDDSTLSSCNCSFEGQRNKRIENEYSCGMTTAKADGQCCL